MEKDKDGILRLKNSHAVKTVFLMMDKEGEIIFKMPPQSKKPKEILGLTVEYIREKINTTLQPGETLDIRVKENSKALQINFLDEDKETGIRSLSVGERSEDDSTSYLLKVAYAVEHMEEGVCEIGPDNRFIYVNPAMYEIVECDDLIGKDFTDFIPNEEDKNRILKSMKSDIVGASRQYEQEIVTPKGNRKILGIAATTTEKGASFTIMKDITRERDLQKAEAEMIQELCTAKIFAEEASEKAEEAKAKAEAADKMKSAFLANMSHEVRTPMNAVLGFNRLSLNEIIELLKKSSELSEDVSERVHRLHSYVQIIEKSGEDLLRIINDLLDVAQIESGEMSISKEPVSISEEVQYVVNRFAKTDLKLRQKKIPIEICLSEENLILNLDKVRFRQVLTNLIRNSIKFTDRGKIVVGFEKIKGDFVEFFVKDSGLGINPKKLDSIFNRFEKSNYKNQEGVGLGLSIVKSLVGMHGGEVWAESNGKNEGTTFRFTVPYQEGLMEKNKVEQCLLSQQEAPNLQGKKVLIVDDNQMNQILLKKIVVGTNAEVFIAAGGKEAVDIVKRQKGSFDIILMDMSMPGEDKIEGNEATKIIKSEFPNIPIVMQSASVVQKEQKESFKAGAERDFITKPYTNEKIYEVLKKYVLDKNQ